MIHSTHKIAEFGEVFTPSKTVEEMLDMLDASVWADPAVVFVETSCGDGAFLTAIFRRRYDALRKKFSVSDSLVIILNTMWGTEIQAEHAEECRMKLLAEVRRVTKSGEMWHYAADALHHHVRCGDGLEFDGVPSCWEVKRKSDKQ